MFVILSFFYLLISLSHAAALPIIITFSDKCATEKTDQQILTDLIQLQKSFRNETDLTIPSPLVTSKILSTAYYRLKDQRENDNEKRDSLSRPVVAEHISEGRPLAEGDIEGRRDRELALLEAVVNADLYLKVSSDVSTFYKLLSYLFVCLFFQAEVNMQNYQTIRSKYLPNLKIDIVQNTLDDPSALIKLASLLPCLLVPPEEDAQKARVFDVMSNDARFRGRSKSRDVNQWGTLETDS